MLATFVHFVSFILFHELISLEHICVSWCLAFKLASLGFLTCPALQRSRVVIWWQLSQFMISVTVRCCYDAHTVVFLPNPHKNTHSSPMRARCGVSFVGSKFDRYSDSVAAVMFAISCDTGPCYNSTRLYIFMFIFWDTVPVGRPWLLWKFPFLEKTCKTVFFSTMESSLCVNCPLLVTVFYDFIFVSILTPFYAKEKKEGIQCLVGTMTSFMMDATIRHDFCDIEKLSYFLEKYMKSKTITI